MRMLKEKEAVHCKTQKEFDAVILEFKKHNLMIFECVNGFYIYLKETCLSKNKDGMAQIASRKLFKEYNYKILSYSEFMEDEWKPKIGENYWFIDFGIETEQIKRIKSPFDDTNMRANNYFRTRELARQAKKKIEQVLKECKHG